MHFSTDLKILTITFKAQIGRVIDVTVSGGGERGEIPPLSLRNNSHQAIRASRRPAAPQFSASRPVEGTPPAGTDAHLIKLPQFHFY